MTRTIADCATQEFLPSAAFLLSGPVAAGATITASSAPLPPLVRVPPAVRIAIEDLIAECGWAYDTGNMSDFLAAFAEDAELVLFGKAIPRAGLGEFLTVTANARGSRGWQHRIGHHRFTAFKSASCEVHSYFTMVAADPGGANARVELIGTYCDHLVLTPNGWRIRERRIVPWTGKAPG